MHACLHSPFSSPGRLLVGGSVDDTVQRGLDKNLLGVISEKHPSELTAFIIRKPTKWPHFHWKLIENGSQIHFGQPYNKQVPKMKKETDLWNLSCQGLKGVMPPRAGDAVTLSK